MVLVTGASGFVGRHVVQRLVARGRAVRCLVRSNSAAEALRALKVETAQGDVTAPATLQPAMRGVQAVVHLVAVIREHPRRGITFERVNRLGTRNVVRAAKEAGAQRFIHMGAIGTVDDPRYRYLYSKWLAEEEVKAGGIPWTILRSSIIVGEEDEFITTLAKLVHALPVVPVIGDGKTLFQYIWVHDVAECVARCLERQETAGTTIEIGGPEHITYDQTLDVIGRKLGKRRPRLHIPVPVMSPLVKVMEKVMVNPPITSEQLRMIALDNITDKDAVPRHFGFSPKPLDEAIAYMSRL